jgi:hypothetical protein
MRHDVAPGAVFPDYELPDQTGKLRKLSELQGDDPLILTLARSLLPKKNTSSIWNSPRFIQRQPWRTRRSPRFQPTTTTPSRSFERRSEPSGHSFPTPTESFRRTSGSRSTPTLSTIR